MTRHDPRGADRRKPSAFGAETGYDVDASPGPHRRQFAHKPKRVVPDCGCHCYEVAGVVYTRCERHAPAGGRDLGPVLGQCVACVTQ